MNEQYHFDFKDWEAAFAMFYRKRCGEVYKDENGEVLGSRKGNPKIALVVSTNAYSSGYWIEEGAEPDDDTKVYKTVAAVRRLEKRIRQKRESTVNLSLGGVVR